MPSPSATTSSYAILGLLAVQPFTAQELTTQSQRSLHWVWRRSERSLYSEPKRLVDLGWAVTRPRRQGRRTTPEYRITPAGRRALRSWLATEPAEPGTEIEAMLRLVFADSGSTDHLRAALRANADHLRGAAETQLVEQCRGYLDDGGPFPERLHLIGLYTEFYVRFIELIEDWTDDALDEIDRWPDTRAVGMTDGARQTFERALERFAPPPT